MGHAHAHPALNYCSLNKKITTIFNISAEYHEKYGCGHSDELYYNFDFVGDDYVKFSESDFEFTQNFNILWTNFAKTGNPNGNNVMLDPDHLST